MEMILGNLQRAPGKAASCRLGGTESLPAPAPGREPDVSGQPLRSLLPSRDVSNQLREQKPAGLISTQPQKPRSDS